MSTRASLFLVLWLLLPSAVSADYIGDFATGVSFDCKFATVSTTGAPTTLAGTPVISAYPDNSLTEITAGITLSVDFDGLTGLHNIRVVATGANGYAAATNYALVITTGTVGGTSVVGYVPCQFSLDNRKALLSAGTGTGQLDFTSGVTKANATQILGTAISTPATAGILDVNVKNIDNDAASASGTVTFPNATLASTTNLTAGTIATVTNQLTAAAIATGVWQDATAGDFTVASSIGKSLYTGNVVPGGTNGLFIAGTNAATTITTGLTTTFTGNLTGSVGSVTGAVGSVTGLTASNLDTTVSSRMATYTQPTGFLAATFPSGTIANTTNLTAGTIATVTNQLTAAAIATGVWQDATAGDFTVASSIGKSVYTSGVVPGGAGGLFIAGTNAATTITTGLTTTFTGNVTGSVASVTGAVGSVTGLTASNLDTTVSSRMATYTQPTGFLAATFPTGTIANTTNLTAGTIATVTNQLTAAQIATGVWQDAVAGDFTTASSIGKSLYTGNVAPGGAGGLFIAGTNAATTITTGLTTTFTGNVTGSVGSVTGAVGSVTGLTASNLDTTVSSRMATYTQPSGFLAAAFPTGTVASTTNITAGTVTTATTAGSIGVGGITAGSFAAGVLPTNFSSLSITAAGRVKSQVGNAKNAGISKNLFFMALTNGTAATGLTDGSFDVKKMVP